MTNLTGKVLVTGGCGFIGSHMVARLVESGCTVDVVDNLTALSPACMHRGNPSVRLMECELGGLLEAGGLDLSVYSAVIHMAANAYVPPSVERPYWDFNTNLHNTIRLLEALRCLPVRPTLIYFSSAAVYGDPARLPIVETDPTVPVSPYGVGKLAAERYVDVYSRLYGLPAASLRLFSVYGPGQAKQVVYDLFRKITAAKEVPLFGDGTEQRDFVFVDDVVDAVLCVLRNGPCRGEVYNVASGYSIMIRDLAVAAATVCGRSPTFAFTGSVRPGDAKDWVVSVDRLCGIGFKAKTSLPEGLKAVWNWYQRYAGGTVR